jgi:hypothetical protein
METAFEIKTYSFAELAQLYFPQISKKSASWQLSRWIEENPWLKQKLEAAGKKPRQRILSPLQVKLIITAFGEP